MQLCDWLFFIYDFWRMSVSVDFATLFVGPNVRGYIAENSPEEVFIDVAS